MYRITIAILWLGLGCLTWAPAQHLQIKLPLVGANALENSRIAFTGGPDFSASASGTIRPAEVRPKFVRENPRGYSYLCRLELEIEEKMPVGVWIKTSDPTEIPNSINTNAHVRLRLFNF